MSPSSQASSGVIFDIFSLISRPITLVLAASVFTLCVLLDYHADHPLFQACFLFIGANLLARSMISFGRQRWSISLALLGTIILILGFSHVYQRAGELNLLEGQEVESYLRGSKVAVDHHLGGSFKLTTDEQSATFEMVGRERVSVPYESLKVGLVVELDEWRFSLEDIKSDSSQPRAQIKVRPRDPESSRMKTSRVLTLSEGQSLSPDGQTLMTALNISGDRGGVNAPNLGAGAELLLKWGDHKLQRAWHYVNPPALDKHWGESPLIIEQLNVIPSLKYNWRVQSRASHALMMIGLLLLGLASILSAATSFSSKQ